MIKRKLFKNIKIKAFVLTIALSMTVVLNGCGSTSHAATPVVGDSVQIETDSSDVLEMVNVSKEVATKSVDIVAPAITVGEDVIEVMEGTEVDILSGVSAFDDEDGDITSSIGVSAYDKSLLDEIQTITYTVSDASGNLATATATLTIKSDPIEVLDKEMFAIESCNVREGTTSETEKLSGLSFAESVRVTGRDKSTGWYRIAITDTNSEPKVGFVASDYLSDVKPEVKAVNSNPSRGGGVSEKAPSDKVVVTPTESPSVEDAKAVPENPVSDQSADNNTASSNRVSSEDEARWLEASVSRVDRTPDIGTSN